MENILLLLSDINLRSGFLFPGKEERYRSDFETKKGWDDLSAIIYMFSTQKGKG